MRQFPFTPGPIRRPPGRGGGLDGPACQERAGLDQGMPPGCRPCQRMCIRCGRVTSRGDGDGYAWCGGVQPTSSTDGGWEYRNDLEGPAATETPLETA